MSKMKDPPPRYNPKPEDWKDFDYIPFIDSFGHVYQAKKDSKDYYNAIIDNDTMMNKEEWYTYVSKQNAKANNVEYKPTPIPKEWQNPKQYDMSKEAMSKREADAKKAINDEKKERSIIKGVGAISGILSAIPSPFQGAAAGIALGSDIIDAYNNYRDAKNKAGANNGKEYNYKQYLSENKGEAIKDYIDMGLDLLMLKKIPRFQLAKNVKSYNSNQRKLLNAGYYGTTSIGAANDTYDLVNAIKNYE